VGELTSGNLAAWVDHVLEHTALPHSALTVEVTESALLEDVPAIRRAFTALRRKGVRIAIDDFGTGYSSLARLEHLPVDIIKLDRAFVTDLGSRRQARAMAGAILSLSRALGVAMVAEGVETEEQAAILLDIGYESGQGYLFGRPMPLRQLRRMVRRGDPTH
jgi:EAL domain-containing protein (putative c-di-GMP-specific phosphodiesterase class I)